ncbi:MAG: ABC transporter permease, partial [Clostridiales bacterium]|nr:ABC transporter permease [Clostridiales bacterium]
MKKQKTAHREPLIRISKKDSMLWYRAWGIRAVAIFAALILSAFVIVLLTGYNPFEVYKSMIAG